MPASFFALLHRADALSRQLWHRALHERSSPREVGISIGIGVFAGCTPFFGFHLGLAVFLASLLRKNRLWAALGSRVSFAPLFAVISLCEIQSAHRLRTGTWVPLGLQSVVAQGKALMLDWSLGTCLVGVPLAAMAGVIAYWAARRWPRINSPKRAAPPPRSSEFPPSAPRAPTP